MNQKPSHLDESGNPRMVDVGSKPLSERKARARALVRFPAEAWQILVNQDFIGSKGSILQVAQLAGVMGAKKTGELIPLCHPLGLDHVDVQIIRGEQVLEVWTEASVKGRTGVEMEAMTAASLAALTLYDMCKSLSHDIRIESVMLMEKSGGKRDFKRG